MIDRAAIYNEISDDGAFRQRWRRRALRWDNAVPTEERNAGRFRRRAIDAACDAIDAGERDKDKIVEAVCGSFVGSIIVGILTRLLISVIVDFILKRVQQQESEAC